MNISQHVIEVLAATALACGVSVVVLGQLFKKIAKVEGAIAHVFVIVLSFAGSALQYSRYLKGVSFDVLGISAPAIYGFSQGLYTLTKKAQAAIQTYQVGRQAAAAAAPNGTSTVTIANPAPADPNATATTSDF